MVQQADSQGLEQSGQTQMHTLKKKTALLGIGEIRERKSSNWKLSEPETGGGPSSRGRRADRSRG